MQTQDIEIAITAVIFLLLGIWIGCKYMDYIYNRDMAQMANHILELEKKLSK
jgi:hypothetical protein